MGRGWANESAETDGVRAGATTRWVNNSGPAYAARDLRILRIVDDVAYFQTVDGAGTHKTIKIEPRQMSYASWFACEQAKTANVISLLIRTDPTGHPVTE